MMRHGVVVDDDNAAQVVMNSNKYAQESAVYGLNECTLAEEMLNGRATRSKKKSF